MIKYWAPNQKIIQFVEDLIQPGWKVLEIGPGEVPFSKATHFVNRPNEIQRGYTTELDIVKNKLPFEDKSFDFIFCRHVVEDLVYPDLILSEMNRVGKAGYIETPSPMAELTKGVDGGDPPYRGYIHHRWIVWNNGHTLCLIEKASVIEHYTDLDEHEWLRGALNWNTYFIWENEFKFKRYEHDIDYKLHINYNEMLKIAISQSKTATTNTAVRLGSTDGGVGLRSEWPALVARLNPPPVDPNRTPRQG